MTLTRSITAADTSQPVPNLTTGDLLRQAAAERPAARALVEVVPAGEAGGDDVIEHVLTYAQLLDRATGVAQRLLRQFTPGDRIAVYAPNSADWVILQYGAALAGIVLVTANPAFQAAELRYVLEQSRSNALFHASAFRGTDMAKIARAAVEGMGGVLIRDDLHDWVSATGAPSADLPLPAVEPDDPAQIQYTSGTTGFPKGALLHHRGVVGSSGFMIRRAQLPVGGTFATAMPLFHTGGCAMSVLGTAHQRACLVVCRLFDPGLLLAAAARHRADLVFGVPTMLIAMLAHPSFPTTDLSGCSIVLSGGSTVPPELVRRVESGFGARFTTVFGQTELAPIVTQTSPDDDPEDKADTCGRPLPQVEIKIVDPADGEVTKIGVPGEACARGYQRMLGYFDLPELTAETIDEDGWLHTGDLGTLDERGYLRITGRLKDMIIRGGENIYPAEIERILFTHPAVRDAAVLGLPDPKWGETVAAVVVSDDPASALDVTALRAHCRAHLAPHKTPTSWYTAAELPLTASGKIQKFRLRDEIEGGGLAPVFASGAEAPR